MSTPETDMERALADAKYEVSQWDENEAALMREGYPRGKDPRIVRISRALIACREPVTPTPPTTHSRWSKCACGGNLGVTQSMKFCSECGRPIKWTN